MKDTSGEFRLAAVIRDLRKLGTTIRSARTTPDYPRVHTRYVDLVDPTPGAEAPILQ